MNTTHSSVRILFSGDRDNPFVIADKPAGIPSAPLNVPNVSRGKNADNETALSLVAQEIPDVLAVHGKKVIEGGLLHRLDTATRGLLLFARTQRSYDALAACQERGEFRKTYMAVCDRLPKTPELLGGFPPLHGHLRRLAGSDHNDSFVLQSMFRPWGKGSREVRPVLADASGTAALKKTSGKLYNTEIFLGSIQKDTFPHLLYISQTENDLLQNSQIVKCRISRGYRHQVRCHLAWAGLPVHGDVLYNPAEIDSAGDAEGSGLLFFATALEFPHPLDGTPFRFSL